MQNNPYGDTPSSRCAYYRQVCDLPAEVYPPHPGRIVMRTGAVWALTMPASSGRDVHAWMHSHGHRAGPILTHPRSRRWTFLIRPDLSQEMGLFAEMFRVNVSIVGAGGVVALPGPGQRPGRFREWLSPPRDSFRPSGWTVVAAIRDLVGGLRLVRTHA
ncbi:MULTISPECIES: DNA-directed RNA polymerase subunit beta [Nocardia]|uniref:DNA-directed RNA polymerase subunit beta n=1 Tax=Nocardia TaxID=1817 RepID=UPI00135B923A|nr:MULTISPECIES: DNA-directed RNA polymerase subunit beta [Nocardia]